MTPSTTALGAVAQPRRRTFAISWARAGLCVRSGLPDAAKAGAITRNYKLKKELEPLLADDPSPLQFLDRLLLDERHVPDAVDFLVYALPKREAVWWGCLCVERFLDVAVLREERRQASRSVMRWVMEPNEEHRRATQEAGFDAHLVKPVDPDELVKAIEAAA